MEAGSWRPAGPGEPPGPVIEAFDRALGRRSGTAVRRFRAGSEASAALLPAELIALVADRPPDADVLVVDPPDGEAALALLARLGATGGAVLVALPAGEPPVPGLRAVSGLLSVPGPDGDAVEYHLFAPSGGSATKRGLTPGPKPGESVADLDARARWFESRHHGPGQL